MTSRALERGANFEYGADPHPKGPASASINANEVMNRGPRTAEEVSGRCSAAGLGPSPASPALAPSGGGELFGAPLISCHRNREGSFHEGALLARHERYSLR